MSKAHNKVSQIMSTIDEDTYSLSGDTKVFTKMIKQAVKDLKHRSKKIRNDAATWLLEIDFNPHKITDKALQEWIFNNL